MSNLSDTQLLEELQQRFVEKNRLLAEQKQFTTDLKTVNKKLLQSEMMKTQFLSNIKNEINNPMTSIMGLLKINMSTATTVEDRMRNIQYIYKEASALNFQLQNLFMAAELEAGEAQLELSQFSCAELIGEAVNLVQSQDQANRVACVVSVDAEEKMLSDRHKLLIILSNIISNAFKFNRDAEASVEIELSHLDDQLLFSIRDTGVGISRENKAQIYDRFNQLEVGTTKSYGGHGLGLSIVHSLVDLLKGSMEIQSTVGVGTTVEVSLPLELDVENQVLFADDVFELFVDGDQSDQVF
ncbi:hypothetical protein BFP72_05835 [Reichenbachiella sp. 5M10]|uniref:sensor histidine kinase n=1 Tax=Reichenbachiella sp. 5M10 TaxID=1889772 RepID=UPI000C14C22D|nr:HAMP domain-containing sensor histidine kinase [Reichenbachiella sp. 5M10]PIB34948.1 hypothetical protein BFP72_05835 [Reichenbachiella sp. 5M10]